MKEAAPKNCSTLAVLPYFIKLKRDSGVICISGASQPGNHSPGHCCEIFHASKTDCASIKQLNCFFNMEAISSDILKLCPS